jgi:hypothetical protein
MEREHYSRETTITRWRDCAADQAQDMYCGTDPAMLSPTTSSATGLPPLRSTNARQAAAAPAAPVGQGTVAVLA